MRTGKHQFNWKRYAIIWAKEIMDNNSKYSLVKAYQINIQFGNLVEEYLNNMKKLKQSIRNYRMAILQAHLEGLQKEFKVLNKNTEESITKAENMVKEFTGDNEYEKGFEEFKKNWNGTIDFNNDDIPEEVMDALKDFSNQLDNMSEQIETVNEIIKIKKGLLDDD